MEADIQKGVEGHSLFFEEAGESEPHQAGGRSPQ